jgi:VIT1/CCC1 family predicted Fe2+/Mn2+ transporter
MDFTPLGLLKRFVNWPALQSPAHRFFHALSVVGFMEEESDYASSVVLGISDALIEMTGILAGLTFALRDMELVALSGLVTGVAASFSMGASEFLSKRAEATTTSPLTAALSTWASYLGVVTVLILPYLILETGFAGLEAHVAALAMTLGLGVSIVAVFSKWLAKKQGKPFLPRFAEMLGILAFITVLSYGLGVGLAAAVQA